MPEPLSLVAFHFHVVISRHVFHYIVSQPASQPAKLPRLAVKISSREGLSSSAFHSFSSSSSFSASSFSSSSSSSKETSPSTFVWSSSSVFSLSYSSHLFLPFSFSFFVVFGSSLVLFFSSYFYFASFPCLLPSFFRQLFLPFLRHRILLFLLESFIYYWNEILADTRLSELLSIIPLVQTRTPIRENEKSLTSRTNELLLYEFQLSLVLWWIPINEVPLYTPSSSSLPYSFSSSTSLSSSSSSSSS